MRLPTSSSLFLAGLAVSSSSSSLSALAAPAGDPKSAAPSTTGTSISSIAPSSSVSDIHPPAPSTAGKSSPLDELHHAPNVAAGASDAQDHPVRRNLDDLIDNIPIIGPTVENILNELIPILGKASDGLPSAADLAQAQALIDKAKDSVQDVLMAAFGRAAVEAAAAAPSFVPSLAAVDPSSALAGPPTNMQRRFPAQQDESHPPLPSPWSPSPSSSVERSTPSAPTPSAHPPVSPAMPHNPPNTPAMRH